MLIWMVLVMISFFVVGCALVIVSSICKLVGTACRTLPISKSKMRAVRI